MTVKWKRFTKRTDDPKLAWIERQLAGMGIPSRRNGSSAHAPILEVPEEHLDRAWQFLMMPFDGEVRNGKVQTVDEVDDDDPTFMED